MPTYDMLVADELLPEFVSDNPRLPEGFQILGSVEGPAEGRPRRFRVKDDDAPPWTEGKLIDPVFTAEYEVDDAGHPTGNVARVMVTGWDEVTWT